MALTGSACGREIGLSLLVFFLAFADACGGSAPAAACKPGDLRPCASPGCWTTCRADGTFENDCSCGSGGAGAMAGGGGYAAGGYGGGGGYAAASGGSPAANCTPAVGLGGSTGVGGYGGCGACPSYTVYDTVPMPSCCTADGACGVWVDPSTEACLSLNPGCYRTAPSGAPDTSCGSIVGSMTFPGCCRVDTGACGFAVDYGSVGGPDLGCTDFFGYGGGGPQGCTTANSCAICRQKNCWPETKDCLTSPDCAAIVNCVASCSDAACAGTCASSYPNGSAAYDALALCVTEQCTGKCP